MKILCLGDVHLGAGPDLGAKSGDRLADQERVLERVLDIARRERIDNTVFVGDAFHRRYPTPAEILVWQEFVYNINNEFFQSVEVAGNHDTASMALPTGLDLAIGGQVSRTPEIVEFDFPGASRPVSVATLPWTPLSNLVARHGGGDRDEVADEAVQLLLESARELRARIPAERVALLACHWSVSGAALPTGMPTDVLREPVLPLAELLTLGYDAIVLGHIHKPQLISPGRLIENGNGSHVVDSPCPVFYVGSPAVVDWGETGFRHGVWILDTDEMQVSFHPVEDRPFVTVDIDLTETTLIQGEDETDAIAAALAEHLPLSDALIRLRYTATAEQARRLNIEALRGFCADAGAAKLIVRPEILREDRVRVAGVDESMSELDALDLYIEHNFAAIPSPRAAELRDLTTTYLEAA